MENNTNSTYPFMLAEGAPPLEAGDKVEGDRPDADCTDIYVGEHGWVVLWTLDLPDLTVRQIREAAGRIAADEEQAEQLAQVAFAYQG